MFSGSNWRLLHVHKTPGGGFLSSGYPLFIYSCKRFHFELSDVQFGGLRPIFTTTSNVQLILRKPEGLSTSKLPSKIYHRSSTFDNDRDH